ncbi:MAG: SprT family zinc-dependent metalloprotease [Pseudomonadota bacterium]
MHILEGDPEIELHVRRHARARRITLRVSAFDGKVSLTLPPTTKARDALAFARAKRAWIELQLKNVDAPGALAIGASVPVEGRALTLVAGAGRRARIEGAHLVIPARHAAAPAPAVKAFLKLLARDRLAAASDHFSGRLGIPYARMTLRDTRSRWGSCSSNGALMYSWRLVMAPPEVLAYVAAHEVAHLAQMNHSAAFWAQLERLMPDYRNHKDWLRHHGAALQRIVLD